MSLSTLTTIYFFLFSIERSLGGFDGSVGLSNSTLSNMLQSKIDSKRVIFDDERRSRENSSIYNRGESGSNREKQDRKSYDDVEIAREEHDKGRRNLGESESLDRGRNSFEKHSDGHYKKGHHRTGFSNNYHKDESGSNSSFYDDSDDQRGHRSSQNNGGYYGQKSQDSFKDGSRDASYAKRDRLQKGLHDNRENVDVYRGQSGERSNNRYNNDKKDYSQDEMDRIYDRNGKEFYYHIENVFPIFRRNRYYMPSFGYSRHYEETLPRDYYKEDPFIYSGDYRYFPNLDERDFERDIYYPGGGYYNRHFDDIYDDDYNNKYRRDFHGGYHRF